jgi:GT2 family glycosyltransferase
MNVAVVITTHRRTELLRRTLKSVQLADRPEQVRSIYVLENDTEQHSDVTAEFTDLPIEYRFYSEANKSRALNWLLPELSGMNVVFLDDDVIVPRCLLKRYCDAFERSTSEHEKIGFWGGAVVPDFEVPPPAWLLKKLPRSVTGWTLGDEYRIVSQPDFLGCNWAANADAIQATGGFDESRGPGTNTVTMGQEYSSQRRLLDGGYQGLYIPGAPVQHYVPIDRCSPEWALQRAEKNGRGFGLRYKKRFGKWILYPARFCLAVAKVRVPSSADPNLRSDFLRLYDVHRWRGFVEEVSR